MLSADALAYYQGKTGKTELRFLNSPAVGSKVIPIKSVPVHVVVGFYLSFYH